MDETLLSAPRFLAWVVSVAHATGLFEDVFPDPDRFALVLRRDGALHSCTLANIELAVRDLPSAAREEEVVRWLQAMTRPHESPATWASARERVMPAVRTPAAWASVALEHRRGEFVVHEVAPMLRSLVVVDDGARTAWLEREDLESWGVPDELARQVALENLAALSGDGIEPLDSRCGAPMFQVRSEDGLESSRLLLPGWLASFAPTVEGPPIAAVPHRGALVITGMGREDAVLELAELAMAEYLGAPGPLSPALYTVAEDGEGIVPLVLPADHPAARAAVLGHARLLADEHESQVATLRALAEAGLGRVEEPAPLELRTQGGMLQTAARWARDGAWLLPEADRVVLEEGGERREFAFTTVADERYGLLERVDGMDPPRWRTVRWPEEGELDRALRAMDPS